MSEETHWKYMNSPWLVRLSGLSASLWTKRSLARFLVRAHAWVVGWVHGWGHAGGNQLMLLFLSLKKKKKKEIHELHGGAKMEPPK